MRGSLTRAFAPAATYKCLLETIAIFGVPLEKVFQYEPKGKR